MAINQYPTIMDPHNIIDIEAIEVDEESKPAYHYDTKAKPTSSLNALLDQDLSPNFNGPLPAPYLGRLANYTNDLEGPELNNPCVSYCGHLRFYSHQHTCQELNALNDRALARKNPTREDLERLRFLLHEHATAMKDSEAFQRMALQPTTRAIFRQPTANLSPKTPPDMAIMVHSGKEEPADVLREWETTDEDLDDCKSYL
ncbi:uncharacterized protein PAC_12631 [Phialocephala subalpina]|uniref:Uncharacterized protein n=1 Tax=Phialocephala subalpina TaxID=576137 RepID=A0A1L7XCH2_9HELO|nr:uncharacterized protein PAC_12631 [Phialocephala subalpina]